MIYEYKYLTGKEFKDCLNKEPVIIIPNAPVELHGPHLPLGTDIIQAEKMAEMIAEEGNKLNSEKPWIIFPALPIGTDPLPLEGSINTDFKDNLKVLKGIVKSLMKSGIKEFIFTNFHGGARHILAQDLAADYVNERGGKAFAPFGLIFSDFLEGAETHKVMEEILKDFDINHLFDHDIHAGALETSLVMAITDKDYEGHEKLPHLNMFKGGSDIAKTLEMIKQSTGSLSRAFEDFFGSLEMLIRSSDHFKKHSYSGDPKKANKEIGNKLLELFRENYKNQLEKFLDKNKIKGQEWRSIFWKNRHLMKDNTFNLVYDFIWGNR